MADFSHQPVLLEESLAALNIRPDGIYIDATFGRGGHSSAILARLGKQGCLLGLDQDPEAIAYGMERFPDDTRLILEHCNFNQVKNVVEKHGFDGSINGILMDLGVSSPQLDDASRGFSFVRSGPLDMRMDTSRGESAMQWLARVELNDLKNVLKWYGEERFAKRIATAIVNARSERAITTTDELASIVTDAIPVKEKHKHPATRSFQAIRIFINQELKVLEEALDDALSVLADGGRLA
ncbi:MAG TPA: 16S rRNA (cytosine(1402)-N(4))-methyltransferase RsmH, partial [Gammaproteobacteria bacterium]|nr:16S rRNA (cytosine(1402)-N(4))-methyltransferase RsmH [Gammaproteobacteria bacterium]